MGIEIGCFGVKGVCVVLEFGRVCYGIGGCCPIVSCVQLDSGQCHLVSSVNGAASGVCIMRACEEHDS